MISISLCMIVKDEEDYIGACLESVYDLVDEIIIVDTGSSDNTDEIVAEYTDNIFYYEWNYDFAAARNFSFSKATKEYILWLDADDILLEQDRKKLKELKNTLAEDIDIVLMKYNYVSDEENSPLLSYYRERLIKKSTKPIWKEPIHEFIEVKGEVLTSDIEITHTRKTSNGDRNLNIFKKMISSGKELSKRGLLYYAVELSHNNFIEEAIIYFKKYLDLCLDHTLDSIWACYQMALCYEKLNRHEEALEVLFESFRYNVPRAEICCEIGNIFIYKNDYNKAIFWYELALLIEEPKEKWGFIIKDYWGFIPCIQLGICYYYLGDIEKAIYYNEEALKMKPTDNNAIKNKRLFELMQKRVEENNEEVEE